MDKAPEYKFVSELEDGMDTCPIQILSGPFAGIVFRYGKISLKETEDENISVTMDIVMIACPENFDQQNPQFTETVGEIFVNIVENNSPKNEPADLEDDVHQD